MTKEEILFFDRMSQDWDANEILSTPEKIRSILAETGLDSAKSILDLGTGTGVLVPYLSAAAGKEGRIVAVDISTGMLSKAREKFGYLENVTFVRLDFEKEELEEKFDLIYLYCVYPHLHTPRETLTRLCDNNLNRDGRIIIAFPTDETFINNIHKEKKAESDLLPPAPELAGLFKSWGLNATVRAYDSERYIIEIKR